MGTLTWRSIILIYTRGSLVELNYFHNVIRVMLFLVIGIQFAVKDFYEILFRISKYVRQVVTRRLVIIRNKNYKFQRKQFQISCVFLLKMWSSECQNMYAWWMYYIFKTPMLKRHHDVIKTLSSIDLFGYIMLDTSFKKYV